MILHDILTRKCNGLCHVCTTCTSSLNIDHDLSRVYCYY